MLPALLSVALAAPPGDLPPVGTGVPHLDHELSGLRPTQSAPPPMNPAPMPDVVVYGYLPYWVGGLDVVPWTHITHLAIFSVGLNSDGTLNSTSRWTSIAGEAVATAHSYGVKVHITITSFYDTETNSMLGNTSYRAACVSALASQVAAYGADGVNVDFEGLDSSYGDEFVSFIRELNAAVDEVYIATPAIDWNGAFDYDQLAANSNGLFIMGYGYHWTGGDPGPNAPLHGGSPWSNYSLEWSVNDYVTYDAPKSKIILGLPLYGQTWPTTSNTVPGTATGDGSSIVMYNAIAEAAQYGRHYDTVTDTPYYFSNSTHQTFYDDTDSIRAKVAYAVEQGLGGVGFWALGYDAGDPGFWSMMEEETTSPVSSDDSGDPGDDTGDPGGLPVARAGQDILAYLGQTVVLNGSASTGDTFAWTQESGPETELRGADSDKPRITPELEGTYRFSLVTSAGGVESAPDTVNVVVSTPGSGTCSTGARGGFAAAFLAMAFVFRRRARG